MKTKDEIKEKLKLIEKYCIKISNDEKAMCGEHLVADDILEIIGAENE